MLFDQNDWMKHWQETIFPGYCPPKFDKLLSKLQHLDG